jgi:hypothetical protein
VISRKLIPALVAAALATALAAVPANAKVEWLCKPGQSDNPCNVDLATTVFSPFNTQIGVIHPKATKQKIDCFYLYPTVSNQSSTVATKARDPEIRDIALSQVARYSTVCRIFTPLYRQITVQGLTRSLTKAEVAEGDHDLLAAWKQYLAKYNKGRGFVLIGHSQGTFRLINLMRSQIDRNAKLRRRLVSAILLGGNVTVRKGSDRGGDFKNVPACRKSTQVGCVLAYSSFNQTPPDNPIFGRPNVALDKAFGNPTGPAVQVLCTNPAALGGGSAKLDSILPTKEFAPGTLIAAGIQLLNFPLPQASTPFIEGRDLFSGRCAVENGASFLKVTSEPGTPVPSPSPDATWGLHLVDANLAQGDFLKLLQSQTTAYDRRH